ncbi:hypothetical protein HELRODRAFT_187926 [Helobdella robusta]|uniref:Uncharacterized protein n=1 Tax=Helobdella robusta TaxID=6412 RepID=T1FPH2_HELRO|nr:hypothetical protein HELRODRAFT_187926 [Helobdella robusta]ESO12614.1 hypothetical protein HELRODRAFT_187926 [Helobdella robusta]
MPANVKLGVLVYIFCVLAFCSASNNETTNSSVELAHSTPTIQTTVPIPIPKNALCENATGSIHKCFDDFATYYKLNVSYVDSSMVNHLISSYCNESVAYDCLYEETLNKSACSTVANLAQANKTFNYAFRCSSDGLKIMQVSTRNCSANVLEHYTYTNVLLCGLTSSLTCKNRTAGGMLASFEVLKPLNDKCFPTTTPKDIPLLPNPVSPEGITAIVVIVCLTIIVILAGFFFWPKCHNPKAGWFPKKKSKYSPDVKTVAYPNIAVGTAPGNSKA